MSGKFILCSCFFLYTTVSLLRFSCPVNHAAAHFTVSSRAYKCADRAMTLTVQQRLSLSLACKVCTTFSQEKKAVNFDVSAGTLYFVFPHPCALLCSSTVQTTRFYAQTSLCSRVTLKLEDTM